MNLPQSDILTTRALGNIFKDTSATYKYFWFVSILQIHARTDCERISVWDLVIRMVANAWYPIHYFRLSFGKSDSLFSIVMEIHQITQIPIDADVDSIVDILKCRSNERAIKSQLNILTKNVPYRFLRPWINTSDDREMVIRSISLENNCLYSLHKENGDFYIILSCQWKQYLHNHYNILLDFSYWNLVQFLQARNPNVPAISNKIIRPETRSSLANQRQYWDMVINLGGPIRCIYTGKELYTKSYDLDHFIPWSFVSHDHIWNLIPSNGSINASKNDKIPDLDIYLPQLAKLQHNSLKLLIDAGKSPKSIEDYVSLGYTPTELALMSEDNFLNLYERTFIPISQIALNMGFESWIK